MSTAAAFDEYLDRGWFNVFAMPKGAKFPPPKGVTGAAAETPMPHQIDRWGRFDCNIGLRVPDTIIGIDVDNSDGKQGAESLKALTDRLGKLPKTYRSSSRDDRIGGIYFYRVPAGIKWASQAGVNIDIVQTGHRYAVVAPSTHPNGGQYRWYGFDNEPASVPEIETLPDLPQAWIDFLSVPVSVDRHQCGAACQPADRMPSTFILGEIDLTDPVKALAQVQAIIEQLGGHND